MEYSADVIEIMARKLIPKVREYVENNQPVPPAKIAREYNCSITVVLHAIHLTARALNAKDLKIVILDR